MKTFCLYLCEIGSDEVDPYEANSLPGNDLIDEAKDMNCYWIVEW